MWEDYEEIASNPNLGLNRQEFAKILERYFIGINTNTPSNILQILYPDLYIILDSTAPAPPLPTRSRRGSTSPRLSSSPPPPALPMPPIPSTLPGDEALAKKRRTSTDLPVEQTVLDTLFSLWEEKQVIPFENFVMLLGTLWRLPLEDQFKYLYRIFVGEDVKCTKKSLLRLLKALYKLRNVFST
jgi:hypothetical protein